MKLNYIPVLNVLLITDSLGLHKICILKKTNSKGACERAVNEIGPLLVKLSRLFRAGRYISCDMHAHLVSKAGSLISG